MKHENTSFLKLSKQLLTDSAGSPSIRIQANAYRLSLLQSPPHKSLSSNFGFRFCSYFSYSLYTVRCTLCTGSGAFAMSQPPAFLHTKSPFPPRNRTLI
ncbi:hypothetical protein SELSPUOL_00384 [Selenomonas sputigena ATCC 35185]|uniref:Uncharacterized protein n=1 Tax=Selenomonas sputigena (strain ATCC 35185 / DSM 20758 / CCUG 44933 / VPI D19B-28) TaxID=546271 RepID=C9LSF9_SELS3|nr:hypothetical protein SELSPUOL_00384 [Selenomonas sputigena ATCC 35185]